MEVLKRSHGRGFRQRELYSKKFPFFWAASDKDLAGPLHAGIVLVSYQPAPRGGFPPATAKQIEKWCFEEPPDLHVSAVSSHEPRWATAIRRGNMEGGDNEPRCDWASLVDKTQWGEGEVVEGRGSRRKQSLPVLHFRGRPL